jgi:hypothetical protein
MVSTLCAQSTLIYIVKKYFYVVNTLFGLVPVAAPFTSWVCDCSLAEIVYSNPTGARMSVSCAFYVLSSRGLCQGPIPRPDESYRVHVCGFERSEVQQ